MDSFRKGRDKKNFFNSPLSKCRDEQSEFYGIKEGYGEILLM
jgi:hypothetical protein